MNFESALAQCEAGKNVTCGQIPSGYFVAYNTTTGNFNYCGPDYTPQTGPWSATEAERAATTWSIVSETDQTRLEPIH